MFFEYLELFQNFIENSTGFELFVKGVLSYVAFFWIALVIWVARDAINRSNNILFHVFSILLNIFLPIFGLMIYLLIRPPRTLIDKYYEDLEFQALSQSEKDYCPKCNTVVEKDFKFCGECGEPLVDPCNSCKKESSKRFKICPFCGEKKGGKVKEKKKN